MGDPTLSRATISLKTLVQELHWENEGFVLTCYILSSSLEPGQPLLAWLQTIMDSYLKFFTDIQGLPPQRVHDHSVVLK